MFQPAFGHQLEPDANAEERLAPLPHALFQSLDHAGDVGQALTAVGERANPGQHHPVCLEDIVGLGRDLARERRTPFPRGALERLGGGVQIA